MKKLCLTALLSILIIGSNANQPTFPFYPFVRNYDVGNWLIKEQGGKFVQQLIIGTEDDKLIVDAIRNGALEMEYGNPIGWTKFEDCAIEKSVWLSRFYFVPSFARMYYLTGERQYIDEMMTFIESWDKSNPYKKIDGNRTVWNWYDMQVAWRAINLSWAYYLTKDGLTSTQKEFIVELLKPHAEVMCNYYKDLPLRGVNHEAHGALAMLYMGILFPQLDLSPKMVKLANAILTFQVEKAFYSDGGNIEQMFGYYPFQATLFRDAMMLCEANGLGAPNGCNELLGRMLRFLEVITQPDGRVPTINDSYEMSTEYIIASLRGLLGQTESVAQSSHILKESGIGVIRSNSQEHNWYLLGNCVKMVGNHAQDGKLNIIAWYNRNPIFVDSGCGSYDDPLWKPYYKMPRSHNTIIVDGDQGTVDDANVRWDKRRFTKNDITIFSQQESVQLIQMHSPKDEFLNRGVNWYRNIILVKDKYLLIYDNLSAKDKHDFEILFHFPPIEISRKDDKNLIIGTSLTMIAASAELYKDCEISSGYVNIDARNIEAPVATYKIVDSSEVNSIFMISPSRDVTISQKCSGCDILLTITDSDETVNLTFQNALSDPNRLKILVD